MRYFTAGLTFTLALAMVPLTITALIEGLMLAVTGPLSLVGTLMFIAVVIWRTASRGNFIWQAVSTCVSIRPA
ncbi:MAG: hypothetical protein J7556_22305 [Acidovorax sp.]|nr:hypothetical protein [Acidovorax sp.]